MESQILEAFVIVGDFQKEIFFFLPAFPHNAILIQGIRR